MDEFVVMGKAGPLQGEEIYVVLAGSEEEALTKYVKKVIAFDDLHREFVRNLSMNVSFAEKFYLESDQEIEGFTRTGETDTEPEVVHSRVRRFFKDRPDLGGAYLKYMETEDSAFLSDELFEFIALQLAATDFDLVAILLRSLPVLE